MPMNESTRHFDLLKAFSQPTCPVCHLVLRDMKRDMDTLMVERINAVDTHLAFRAARGLCNAHAWHITRARGGSLSIAVMFESTMVELRKDAAKIKPNSFGRFRGKIGADAADKLEASGDCLLCTSMNKSESSYIGIIAENILDSQLQAAYHASMGGLCLPHGRLTLRQLGQANQVEAFMTLQSAKWEALQADLQLYIDKNEANDTQMGQEGDSWQRAIRYLSGEENVFGYRR